MYADTVHRSTGFEQQKRALGIPNTGLGACSAQRDCRSCLNYVERPLDEVRSSIVGFDVAGGVNFRFPKFLTRAACQDFRSFGLIDKHIKNNGWSMKETFRICGRDTRPHILATPTTVLEEMQE